MNDFEIPEVNPIFANTMMMFSGAMGAVETDQKIE